MSAVPRSVPGATTAKCGDGDVDLIILLRQVRPTHWHPTRIRPFRIALSLMLIRSQTSSSIRSFCFGSRPSSAHLSKVQNYYKLKDVEIRKVHSSTLEESGGTTASKFQEGQTIHLSFMFETSHSYRSYFYSKPSKCRLVSPSTIKDVRNESGP